MSYFLQIKVLVCEFFYKIRLENRGSWKQELTAVAVRVIFRAGLSGCQSPASTYGNGGTISMTLWARGALRCLPDALGRGHCRPWFMDTLLFTGRDLSTGLSLGHAADKCRALLPKCAGEDFLFICVGGLIENWQTNNGECYWTVGDFYIITSWLSDALSEHFFTSFSHAHPIVGLGVFSSDPKYFTKFYGSFSIDCISHPFPPSPHKLV